MHPQHIIYINLERRTDRRKSIESQFPTAERFTAIEHSNGAIGCQMSHIQVLKNAKEKKYSSVLILEDDFIYIHDNVAGQMEKFNVLLETTAPKIDVCLLSYSNTQNEEFGDHQDERELLIRIRDAQTASGYIVFEHYYDKLIENFEEGLALHLITGEHWNYAVDQYWKKLQKEDVWVAFKERIGIQMAGYSDLANAYVDYGV